MCTGGPSVSCAMWWTSCSIWCNRRNLRHSVAGLSVHASVLRKCGQFATCWGLLSLHRSISQSLISQWWGQGRCSLCSQLHTLCPDPSPYLYLQLSIFFLRHKVLAQCSWSSVVGKGNNPFMIMSSGSSEKDCQDGDWRRGELLSKSSSLAWIIRGYGAWARKGLWLAWNHPNERAMSKGAHHHSLVSSSVRMWVGLSAKHIKRQRTKLWRWGRKHRMILQGSKLMKKLG